MSKPLESLEAEIFQVPPDHTPLVSAPTLEDREESFDGNYRNKNPFMFALAKREQKNRGSDRKKSYSVDSISSATLWYVKTGESYAGCHYAIFVWNYFLLTLVNQSV